MSNSPVSVRVTPSNGITKCTDPESSRYALSGVVIVPVIADEPHQIGIDNAGKPMFADRPANRVFAVATDSRVLAVASMEGMAATEVLCPGKLLTPPVKAAVKSVELNGQWQATQTKTRTGEKTAIVAESPEGRFPRYQDVIPRSFGSYVAVTLDPQLLLNLTQALNDPEHRGLTLIINSETFTNEDPVCVLGSNGFGVIMPLECDDNASTRYLAMLSEFQDNQKRENTETRKAQVLAMLNPDDDALQAAAGFSTSEPVTETVVEETPKEDTEAIAHRAKFDAIHAAITGIADICLFPVGAEYFAYAKHAEPLAKALGLPLNVEYADTDHELVSTSFMQSDLIDYFNTLGKANLYIKLMKAL